MKLPLGFLQALLGIYLFYECSELAGGQYYEDVKKHYAKMTLEVLHRGSFNNTPCARELLNCWESIKPDIICTYGITFESLCGLLRRECSDAEPLLYTSPWTSTADEGFCDS